MKDHLCCSWYWGWSSGASAHHNSDSGTAYYQNSGWKSLSEVNTNTYNKRVTYSSGNYQEMEEYQSYHYHRFEHEEKHREYYLEWEPSACLTSVRSSRKELVTRIWRLRTRRGRCHRWKTIAGHRIVIRVRIRRGVSWGRGVIMGPERADTAHNTATHSRASGASKWPKRSGDCV